MMTAFTGLSVSGWGVNSPVFFSLSFMCLVGLVEMSQMIEREKLTRTGPPRAAAWIFSTISVLVFGMPILIERRCSLSLAVGRSFNTQ